MLTRRHLSTRSRCALVALVASVGAVVALRALVTALHGPVGSVDEALVRVCLAALAVTVVWAWLASATVIAEAWRGRPARRQVPAPIRKAVLLCCGVALAAPSGPAVADEPRPTTPASISGLPLPERATGPAHRPRQLPRPARTVVVEPGDCLWHLAAADLPADATTQRITRHWHAIHRLNAAVIGADPDLIRPGQRLVLPPR